MAYVISEPCLTHGPACTLCRAVCPTEAIQGGSGYAYVDEVYCIDCGACLQVCPDGVIYTTEPVYSRGRILPMLSHAKRYVTTLNHALAHARPAA